VKKESEGEGWEQAPSLTVRKQERRGGYFTVMKEGKWTAQ